MAKLTLYFGVAFALGVTVGIVVQKSIDDKSVVRFEITFEIPIFVGHKFDEISLTDLSSAYQTVTGNPIEGQGLKGEIDGIKFEFAPKARLNDTGQPRITHCLRFRTEATDKELPGIQQRLQQIDNDLKFNHPELQTDLSTFSANPLTDK